MRGHRRHERGDMIEKEAEFSGVEELLAAARARLQRLSAPEVAVAVTDGARLVDIRPAWQRARDGEISGALVVERNHLEWRLHPRSADRLCWAQAGQRWIVVCTEGFTSSLAAASLRSIGVDATDLIGGIHAWRAAGLPLVPGPSRVEQVVGAAGTEAGAAAVLLPPAPRADQGRADQAHADQACSDQARSDQPG
jgi:rhodanese-related sulfurtransferase